MKDIQEGIQAIKEAIDMWNWLAEDGSREYKDSYFYEVLGFTDDEDDEEYDEQVWPVCDCFICQYMRDYEDATADCIVDWGCGRKEDSTMCGFPCENEGSPFKDWCEATDNEEREEAAIRVVDRLENALAAALHEFHGEAADSE